MTPSRLRRKIKILFGIGLVAGAYPAWKILVEGGLDPWSSAHWWALISAVAEHPLTYERLAGLAAWALLLPSLGLLALLLVLAESRWVRWLAWTTRRSDRFLGRLAWRRRRPRRDRAYKGGGRTAAARARANAAAAKADEELDPTVAAARAVAALRYGTDDGAR
jgi:hypothetical protein